MRRNQTLLAACLLGTLATPAAFARDWPQFGYDAAHSGSNPDETTISAANVAQLVRRYQAALPSGVDSAPVYASQIQTAGGVRDLVFVTTTSGAKVVALDAVDGSVVWSKGSGSTTTQSSPAIDPSRAFVYGYGADGKVHKYAIGDGTEATDGGWPQISTLKPSVEKSAGAIAIATAQSGTTYLYSVTDGYIGDQGDYQGHITAINLASGEQHVFNSLCSDLGAHLMLNGQAGVTDCATRQSGIWGRPGATYDAATDRIYITTGNGTFDANTGGFNWGDSVLALHPDGSGAGAGMPVDSYTPTEYDNLDGSDTDLGSASLSILPVPAGSAVAHLGLQTGKDSKLRLINLDDMSGTHAPGGVGGEIEVIDVPISEFWMKTLPTVWVDPANDHATWVYMANGEGISGLKLTLAAGGVPHLQPTWQKSTDATSAIVANGVVYHAGGCSGGNCVMARDPHTGEVLWTSPTIGSLHWQSPILVDGALYIAAGSKLHRFDLGDVTVTHVVTPTAGANGSIDPATPQTVDDGQTTSFTLAADAGYAIGEVTGCGGALAGAVYTTGPISADCTVSATFVLDAADVIFVNGFDGAQ
jgi:outer membrane protein assembly factor BamB